MSSKVDQIIRHQTMRALQISVCHAVKGKKVLFESGKAFPGACTITLWKAFTAQSLQKK